MGIQTTNSSKTQWFTDSYTLLTMDNNILCRFPYDTFELFFFLSRVLSNLPSEIQGARAWDISIPKDSAYSKVYIYISRAQAGMLLCCTLHAFHSYSSQGIQYLPFWVTISPPRWHVRRASCSPTKGSGPHYKSLNYIQGWVVLAPHPPWATYL